MTGRLSRRWGSERGSSTVVAIMIMAPILVAFVGFIADYGAGLEARTFAANTAASAARAGATEVRVVPGVGGQLDQAAALATATRYLAAVDTPPGVTMTSSVSTTGTRVTVEVTTSFAPRFVPIADRTVTRVEHADALFGQ